jgi:hypothetical protein
LLCDFVLERIVQLLANEVWFWLHVEMCKFLFYHALYIISWG